ncbi:rhodanese domain-containing protein CG4456-like [Lucilia sericata]|uniref:rhodanese domain-containing protein CG4456-like n=1 Tax=Lucilia sericata TaxID=13632 RepID=UPI0018A854F2|nr:rhodanese domain-containing protein CG4456-like [Lucilia sericata]XP_037816092.1 rhodanese domain-containing protein CG4456-like [Lucilia sericata]
MATRTFLRQLNRMTCLKAVRTGTSSIPLKLSRQNLSFLTTASKSLNSVNFAKQQYSTMGENNIPIVTYEEIKKLTNQSAELLIDVREPKELQETGKIPNSINIPLGQVGQELADSVDKAAFKAKYGRDKPEKNSEIIFHCRSGKRSQSAAELARTLGYENTKNYVGSWLEYAEKEGLPK